MLIAKTHFCGEVAVNLNGAQRLALQALFANASGVGVRAHDLEMGLDKAQGALDRLVALGLAKVDYTARYKLSMFRDFDVRGPFFRCHRNVRRVRRYSGLEWREWERRRHELARRREHRARGAHRW